MNRDRPLDRGQRLVEPVDDVRGPGELLEHRRLLDRWSSIDECRCPSVMGVRLPVRLERRCPSCGDERVGGDDILGARRFGVVHDVGRVGVGRQKDREDLGVQAAPGGDRDA